MIEQVFDTDAFGFEAIARETYTITVDLNTLSDSTLSLIDMDGLTVLDENDDYGGRLASRLEWIAPRFGIYFFLVNSADVSLGSYTVTVTGTGATSEEEYKDAELAVVQLSIDLMIADNKMSAVIANPSAAKIVGATTDFGGEQLILAYFRDSSTTYCYTWDSTGLILAQSEPSGSPPKCQ